MKNYSAHVGILLISAVISNANGETGARVLQPRMFNPGVQQQQRGAVAVPPAAGTAQRGTPAQGVRGNGTLPPQKVVRRVASTSDTSYNKIRVKKNSYFLDPDRATDMRFFIAGGISGMASADADIQANRDLQKLGSNYLVGIGADIRMRRYFGLELDVYYGIAPTQTIVYDDDETQKKKLQHTGGMLNLKGQYPTYIGNMRLTPKVGVGYGMLKLNQSTESQQFAETIESSETVKGVYGTAGFDFEPVDGFIFFADYAMSLMGSGSFSVKSTTINSDTELTDVSFNRMRLGVLVRVHPNVWVGANFTKRAMKFSADDDATSSAGSLIDISNSESLTQIAGQVLFQF